MFDWFEKLVRETIYTAVNDPAARIIEKPQSPTAVQQLSTTPLMRVTGAYLAADPSTKPVRVPVTIGMRRVADDGVQRNFVASPTLLPAIAP